MHIVQHVHIQQVTKYCAPSFLKWCNCRYACSDAAGKWLYKGMPFSLISNGIDLEKFQYDPVVRERLRNEYDLEDKLVIGHVGRFCEEKNHKKILEMRDEKKSLILVSADLTELRALSDRIIVFHQGKVAGVINDVPAATEEELGLYMLGLKEDPAEKFTGGVGDEHKEKIDWYSVVRVATSILIALMIAAVIIFRSGRRSADSPEPFSPGAFFNEAEFFAMQWR